MAPLRCDVDNCAGDCLGCGKSETDDLLRRFTEELRKPTGDGANKRRRGEKPPWYVDGSHHAAAMRHYAKWLSDETFDPDSGAHHLVHAAWRLLAIACTESGNVPASCVCGEINTRHCPIHGQDDSFA